MRLRTLPLDLQHVTALGAKLAETCALEYRTGGGYVRFGEGQGRAEMPPDPTSFQDKRPVCTPASESLARCRAPQPQRLPHYLSTSRGHYGTLIVCPGR